MAVVLPFRKRKKSKPKKCKVCGTEAVKGDFCQRCYECLLALGNK